MPDADENAESELQLQTILQRFEKPLLQFATRITGDRERARDVVQETFVKFQRNGASDPPSPGLGVAGNPKVATWLFTVCRNGALNVCRKEKRLTFLDEELIESNASPARTGTDNAEMLTVKLRYKKPDGDKSELIERAVTDSNAAFASASPDFKFAAAVAEFGMLLRDSEHKGNGTMGAVLEWAQEGKDADKNGYRAGFLELVRKARSMKKG